MARRLLFPSRKAATPTTAASGAGTARIPEREVFLFRRRLAVAGVLVAARLRRAVRALRLPAGRAAPALPDAGRDQPHRDRPDRAQSRRRSPIATAWCSRRATRPTRWRLQPVAREEPRRDDRRAGGDRRRAAARPQALPQAARGIEEFREPAAAHAPHRRGGRALRRQSLPLPGRRDQGAALPPVSVRRGRLARRRLHRPHQRSRRRAHRRVGRDGELQGLRLHRQGRRRALVRARTARQDRVRGGRGRRRRPRGAHAVAHAAGLRQRSALVARHPAAGGRRSGVRRRGAARWWRSSPRPATCWRSSRKPGFDPNLFVDGIDPANWELLNDSPDKPLLNRPLRGAYPPGSTIKPFLALARTHLRQAHAGADDLRSRVSSRFPGRRTVFATTSRAATARSTCTSRSSRRATRTTTCSPATPTSTTTHRFLSQLGFGQKTGIDIEGELTGVLPSREWKRQRFAGKDYREEHRKWYLGDSISAGIGQGYNAFTPIQQAHAIATIANDGVAFRPHLVKTIRDVRTGDVREVVPEPTHTVPIKPEHLAFIKNALVGVNREGTSAAAFVKTPYVSAGKTGTAQVFSLKGEKYSAQGRRAAARPRVVHRLRAGGQAAHRGRGAGRERRLRRAGRGADRAAGVRLLPDRRRGRRARRRRRRRRAGRRRRERLMLNLLTRLWEVLTRRIDSFLFGVAMAIAGVGLITLFSATDQSVARSDEPGGEPRVRAGADVGRRQHSAADDRARRGAAVLVGGA